MKMKYSLPAISLAMALTLSGCSSKQIKANKNGQEVYAQIQENENFFEKLPGVVVTSYYDGIGMLEINEHQTEEDFISIMNKLNTSVGDNLEVVMIDQVNLEKYSDETRKLFEEVIASKKLKYLSLTNMNLEDISFLENAKCQETLKSICLKRNKIEKIYSLRNFTLVDSMNLDHNQISNLYGISNLTNLKDLQISDNQITNISDLSYLYNLEYLDLSSNLIIDPTPISYLPNLDRVDLSNNKIQNIPEDLDRHGAIILGLENSNNKVKVKTISK